MSDITATAAQSRFHLDAVNVPPTKEILVHDLNLSIGGKELLAHAELKLLPDVHYVLVGRNGVGKSSMCIVTYHLGSAMTTTSSYEGVGRRTDPWRILGTSHAPPWAEHNDGDCPRQYFWTGRQSPYCSGSCYQE